MAISYTTLFFYLHMKAMRAEIYRRRTISQQRKHAFDATRKEEENLDRVS